MNRVNARKILMLFRPGSADAEDPAFAEALQAAARDRELEDWFDRHCSNYLATRDQLRRLEPPPHLLEAILQQQKIIRPAFSRQLAPWLAAAALIILLGSALLQVWQPWSKDRLHNFRSRMLNIAQRQYSMDIITNRADAVRAYIAAQGAPADYQIPDKLQSLALTGGGALRWRNHPVAMVCFDRGDGQMLFLFVVDRQAMRDAPDPFEKITTAHKNLLSVTWSDDQRTYLLAGPKEPGFYQKYP